MGPTGLSENPPWTSQKPVQPPRRSRSPNPAAGGARRPAVDGGSIPLRPQAPRLSVPTLHPPGANQTDCFLPTSPRNGMGKSRPGEQSSGRPYPIGPPSAGRGDKTSCSGHPDISIQPVSGLHCFPVLLVTSRGQPENWLAGREGGTQVSQVSLPPGPPHAGLRPWAVLSHCANHNG